MFAVYNQPATSADLQSASILGSIQAMLIKHNIRPSPVIRNAIEDVKEPTITISYHLGSNYSCPFVTDDDRRKFREYCEMEYERQRNDPSLPQGCIDWLGPNTLSTLGVIDIRAYGDEKAIDAFITAATSAGLECKPKANVYLGSHTEFTIGRLSKGYGEVLEVLRKIHGMTADQVEETFCVDITGDDITIDNTAFGREVFTKTVPDYDFAKFFTDIQINARTIDKSAMAKAVDKFESVIMKVCV